MASATTTIEIDSELLAELRERAPEKTDRELFEELAADKLADDAIARARAAFADVPPEEIEAEAVRITREARHEMAAERSRRTAA